MGRPPRSKSGQRQSGSGPSDRSQSGNSRPRKPTKPKVEEVEIRIVGGDFRGRKIRYSGDERTRPMKNATREAMFNLVGGWVPERRVIDLFAGTGAVGIEAISRGAHFAHFVERHHPTARIIRDNLASLGVESRGEVESADALYWLRQFLKSPPPAPKGLVFCCPPYELFRSRGAEIREALELTIQKAPEGSVIVVEAPSKLDPLFFPHFEQWRFRLYEPAWLAVYRPDAEPFRWHAEHGSETDDRLLYRPEESDSESDDPQDA